jgi:hypothetical protein
MFQYAIGLAISTLQNEELRIDTSYFQANHAEKHRVFGLDHYDISAEALHTEQQVNTTFFAGKYGRKIANRLHDQLPIASQLLFDYYSEVTPQYYDKYLNNQTSLVHNYGPFLFNFYPPMLNLNGDIFLDGYWQTEKYFNMSPVKEKIYEEFSLRKELTGKNKKAADSIQQNPSVGVHIRRGDYVREGYALSRDYYRKSMDMITNKYTNVTFYLFSDDIDWVKENITFSENIKYITNNDVTEGYKDLKLMSLCDHNIIANSTFSWWGAWLNQNDQKLVIAPSIWFKGIHTDKTDIIPERWHIVDAGITE